MTTLLLDGQPTEVAAFCASADERAEKAGIYRLDVLRRDGSAERWWALVGDVQEYRLLQPCGGLYPWH